MGHDYSISEMPWQTFRLKMNCALESTGMFHMIFSTSATTRTSCCEFQQQKAFFRSCRTTWIKTLDPRDVRRRDVYSRSSLPMFCSSCLDPSSRIGRIGK